MTARLDRRSIIVISVAAAMFLVITALKLAIRSPGFGFALLYDIPVALLAVTFGARGGLIGAVVGMGLFAVGDAVAEVHSNLAGYASRGLTFVLLGGLLGVYADRLRRDQAKIQRTQLGRAHAAEINDNIVQRLVLTKYALDRGETDVGTESATEALHEAQRLVSSLLEDEDITPGALRRSTPAVDAD
jgi:hypothetical protein